MPLFSANPFCLDLVPYGLRSALRALWGEVSSRPPGPVKTQPRGLVDSDSPHPAPPPPALFVYLGPSAVLPPAELTTGHLCLPAQRALDPTDGEAEVWKTVPLPGSLCVVEGTFR